MTLRASGKRDAANIVKEVSTGSAQVATQIKKAKLQDTSEPLKYTDEEALAYYLDARHSVHTYKLTQTQAKQRHCDLYPPYYIIRQTKQLCYPPKDSILIRETFAEIKLQAIIDCTVKRLIKMQEVVINSILSDLSNNTLLLICKWGCDGSGGHSLYKQKFNEQNNDSNVCTDEYLFVICFVPLQLNYTDKYGNKKIIWQNLRASSTRYCRPIKLFFAKETAELIKEETEKIKQQMSVLSPTNIEISGSQIYINTTLILTMVDGKVCNALADNKSSQTCYICGATPKMMNEKDKSKMTPNSNMYAFGISSLHAWIRSFECLLHISYRLHIRKWQIKDSNEKILFGQRKLEIQKKFRQVGLIVDTPKQGGGNTNDGNTARRFFKNPVESAEITGLSENLIRRFGVILQTISCSYKININAFANYVEDTRQLY